MQKLVKSGYSARMEQTHATAGPGRPPKATHDVIVRAAWELFEQVGFEAATMSAVAEHAGVSRRTLFNHFPHKVALLFPSHDKFMSAFRDELRRQPAAASLFTQLTQTFAAVAPISEELEACFQPGAEVSTARMRDDAVAYWKAVWARELEGIVLDVYGPTEQVKAGFVGAITAQIWTETIALQRKSVTPLRADAALNLVLAEFAAILGVSAH